MLRKTFFATAFLLIGAAALQDHAGISGQTSPSSSAKTQVISSVDLLPLEAGALNVSNPVAGKSIWELFPVRLAVDENGDLYLAFYIEISSPPERAKDKGPYFVKYDRTGRFISAFALPDFLFARPGGREQVDLRSVSIFQDKVYVPSNWRDKANRIRGSILIYTKDGRYERSIDTPSLFVPLQVVVLPTGELFVLGYGWRPGHGYPGSDMIFKLSPTGQVLTSFSPLPVYRNRDVLWGVYRSYLLLNHAGRLVHVLSDATMRMFDLDGRWLKTMSPVLQVGDYLEGVFIRDGVFVFAIVDLPNQRTYLAVVSAAGDALTTTDVSGNPWIQVEGRDGNYYAIGPAGRRAPSDPPGLRIIKMRLELPKL
jgi:hypothetical protein